MHEKNAGPAAARKGSLMRLMAYLFKAYFWRLLAVLVFVVLGALASVAATVVMQRLIDDCIVPGVQNGLPSVLGTLTRILIALAVIYVVGLASSYAYTRIMATVTQGTLRRLRDDMFDHMQSLPIRYFDRHARGDVMSCYTNDTDAARQLIGQSLPMIVQSVLSAVSIFFTMLGYSLWLTAAVVVILFLMIYFTKKLGGKSSRYMMEQQRSLAREEGFVEEMIQGQKVVQVFCHEPDCKRDFEKLNEKLYEDSETANRYGNILMPVLGNIGNLMYVLLAIFGGLMVCWQIPNLSLSGFGGVTIGVIVSFLAMSRQLSMTVGQISMQVPMIAMGAAGASRVFELLDEPPETDDGFITLARAERDENGTLRETDKPGGLWAWKTPRGDSAAALEEVRGDIRLEELDFAYEPGKPVLHDVTLAAMPGQKIAFVGATGAGKTTITNLLNRFYDIQDGKIRFDGIDIAGIRKPDLRRSLGVVLQDVNLFTGTVMDNIRYGLLDASDEDCMAAARLANADDFIRRLPDGYDTVLSGNGASLSQGQRQLLSIARAAVADPPVMILDEATSSIDTRTEALVQAGMDNLMHGRTVFVIAHRLSTVRNSDAILVLDHGRVIERGNHEELLAQKGTYYQLYTGAFELE